MTAKTAAPKITVYSKNDCFQCKMVARRIQEAGNSVTSETFKIDEDPQKFEELIERYPNMLQAPVVVIRTKNPDKYLHINGVNLREDKIGIVDGTSETTREIFFSGNIPDALNLAIAEYSEEHSEED